jgi:hypothetical protein
VGLDELQVVPGVEPAARGVDRPADLGQVADEGVVLVEGRRSVGGGVRVVEVRRAAVQDRGLDVAAVALRGEKKRASAIIGAKRPLGASMRNGGEVARAGPVTAIV